MWSHYCKSERHSMCVEDDKECNWCGETQPDNQRDFITAIIAAHNDMLTAQEAEMPHTH